MLALCQALLRDIGRFVSASTYTHVTIPHQQMAQALSSIGFKHIYNHVKTLLHVIEPPPSPSMRD